MVVQIPNGFVSFLYIILFEFRKFGLVSAVSYLFCTFFSFSFVTCVRKVRFRIFWIIFSSKNDLDFPKVVSYVLCGWFRLVPGFRQRFVSAFLRLFLENRFGNWFGICSFQTQNKIGFVPKFDICTPPPPLTFKST